MRRILPSRDRLRAVISTLSSQSTMLSKKSLTDIPDSRASSNAAPPSTRLNVHHTRRQYWWERRNSQFLRDMHNVDVMRTILDETSRRAANEEACMSFEATLVSVILNHNILG